MLMRIFVRTAEPIWDMMGMWLRDGMSIRTGSHGEKVSDLEEEFFIESSGVGMGTMSMGISDPDFWKEGYCLRDQFVMNMETVAEDGGGRYGAERSVRDMDEKVLVVPVFLRHVAKPVLETGKAIGLVRALGLAQSAKGFTNWKSFAQVIADDLKAGGEQHGVESGKLSSLFGVSVDSLSRVVYDYLSPVCEATGDSLVQIIVDDCELWRHINAVEDLYLMRRGDALGHFIDLLFTKVCGDSVDNPQGPLLMSLA